MKDTIEWNLKEIIESLISNFEQILEIYLFGSRAYKTDSLRSDIDILIFTEKPIPSVHLYNWITENYNAVDIFKTIDKKQADSAINGSVLFLREGFTTLPVQLDAILLWTKEKKFNTEFKNWIQLSRAGIDFKPSYTHLPMTMTEVIENYEKYLIENDFPNSNLGSTWKNIGNNIFQKIENGISVSKNWTGTSGTFNKIKLSNERDFQNFIELLIKPWLPITERESCVAIFDGQEKKIDFSIGLNRILIEAKHIKDSNTQAKSVKEIEGITKFYLSNTNVKLLLFMCLIEEEHSIDTTQFDATFSSKNENTIVLTKCFKNLLK